MAMSGGINESIVFGKRGFAFESFNECCKGEAGPAYAKRQWKFHMLVGMHSIRAWHFFAVLLAPTDVGSGAARSSQVFH